MYWMASVFWNVAIGVVVYAAVRLAQAPAATPEAR
jgi:hypothetical protein